MQVGKNKLRPSVTASVRYVAFLIIGMYLSNCVYAQTKLQNDLSNAIYEGKAAEAVRLAKQLEDINAGDDLYSPPLYEAVMWGHLDVVKALVDAGASVDVRETEWDMPAPASE